MEGIKITTRKGQAIMRKFSKSFIESFDKMMDEVKEKAPSKEEREKLQKAISVFVICEIMEGWDNKSQKELLVALEKDLK